MNKRFLPLFIAGMIAFATSGGWISVQAQQQTQPDSSTPQFTPFQNAGQSGLLRDGKPFKPANLNQSDKPDGNKRGKNIFKPQKRLPLWRSKRDKQRLCA